MCGRYTSTSSLSDLARQFAVQDIRAEPLPARYNVAPTLDVYAVAVGGRRDTDTSAKGGTSANGDTSDNAGRGPRRALGTFRWGLVPSWAKDPSVGGRMINARAEGLTSRPAFRIALARRRCLIPADSFYEWQRRTGPDGRPAGRLPHAIRRRDGQSMAFAGLWEVWRDPLHPNADPLRTCAIVTTEANDVVAPIHSRMPVVLSPEDWDTWLDPDSTVPSVAALLVPAPSAWFDRYPVRSLVNDVRNDGPELLDPLPLPPADHQDQDQAQLPFSAG
jgi:putative SOS response-associated peptidase YedK